MPTLLDALRRATQVDCDTLDADGTLDEHGIDRPSFSLLILFIQWPGDWVPLWTALQTRSVRSCSSQAGTNTMLNQASKAIAYFELLRQVPGESALQHGSLIKSAIQSAKNELKEIQGDATLEEFVVEIMASPTSSAVTADSNAINDHLRWSSCSCS